ncbi:hypothetical protein H9P43_005834 [Blastocladiella emersonii ATCC 22665]|nr:hypothetical protein H9P43_005834 [Blastocladiella emersonii ATCC 22665]
MIVAHFGLQWRVTNRLPVAIAGLVQLCEHGLAQLPEFAKLTLRNSLNHAGQLDVWCNRTHRGKPVPESHVLHAKEFPERELIRALIRFDLGGLLTIISSDGCPTLLDFWRQVPDGALDTVRNAAWVKRAIASCAGKSGEECVKELKRVAPIGSFQR